MRRLLLSTVAFAALGGSALAADLPSTKEAPVYAAPAPAWTGFYVGAFGGYGWGGNQSWSNSLVSPDYWNLGQFMGSGNSSGGFGGIQLGYNWQFAPTWVATLGADLGFGSIGGSVSNPLSYSAIGRCGVQSADQSANCQANANVMADFLVRLGYLVAPSTLLYVKGGLALTNIEYQVNNIVDTTGGTCGPVGAIRMNYNSANLLHVGGVFGAGVEQKFTDHITGFVEYDYTTGGGTHSVFFSNNSGDSCVPSFTANVNAGGGISTIRAGLNYMFAEPAPVVAKY
jgi:outer membrane immunogenic protein